MKKVSVIVASVTSAVIIMLAIFLPVNERDLDKKAERQILTLWQIDSFEGGTGSRSAYLKRVCESFEKNNDCLVTVITETAEDADEKLSRGVAPDVISFSSGCDGVLTYAERIAKSEFSGGAEINGVFYAKAWAYGGYVTIKKKGKIPAETVVAKGKTTLPEVAAYYAGVDLGGAKFMLPKNAFEYFTENENVMLFGTQRDIYRLKNKLDEFDITPIEGFTDLIQYAAVTTVSKDKVNLCEKLVGHIANSGQSGVTSLGLLPVDKNCKIDDNGLIARLFDVNYDKTVSVFLSDGVRQTISERLKNASTASEEKADFLKSVIKSLK